MPLSPGVTSNGSLSHSYRPGDTFYQEQAFKAPFPECQSVSWEEHERILAGYPQPTPEPVVTFTKSVLCVLLERGSLQKPSPKEGLLNPERIQNNSGNFEGYI